VGLVGLLLGGEGERKILLYNHTKASNNFTNFTLFLIRKVSLIFSSEKKNVNWFYMRPY